MQKIVPNLWFNDNAAEAVNFYVSVFPNSDVRMISKMPSGPGAGGTIAGFKLAGYELTAFDGGPQFKINPSISFFVACDTAEEVEALYTKLIEGGSALMPLDSYPFSERYAWVNDRFGVSWQLFVGPSAQKIRPLLMYTADNFGKCEEAMNFYAGIFPNSKVDFISRYAEGESAAGKINHAAFTLHGQGFLAMESDLEHKFAFNEGVSLLVNCDTQEEIDELWAKLSAVPEAEQCGWLKDKYGVSWQITPTALDKLMGAGDAEQSKRVMDAMLGMKKMDIAGLQRAFEGK